MGKPGWDRTKACCKALRAMESTDCSANVAACDDGMSSKPKRHLKTSASCQLPTGKEGKDLSRGRAERKEGLQSGTKVPKMATRTSDGCRRRKAKGGGEHFQGQTVNKALAIHIIIFVLLY